MTVDQLIDALIAFRAVYGGDLPVLSEDYQEIGTVDLNGETWDEETDRPIADLYCELTGRDLTRWPLRPYAFEEDIAQGDG